MKRNNQRISFILVLTLIMSLFSGITAAAAASPYVKSDTSGIVNVASKGSYTFKFTVMGASSGKPIFSVGDAGIIKGKTVSQSGNDYYVTVTAAGKEGQSTGIYSKLPGQNAVRQAVVKIVANVLIFPNDLGEIDLTFDKNNANAERIIKNWSGEADVQTEILWGKDEYDSANLTVTNSNPDVLQITQYTGESSSDDTGTRTIVGSSFTARTTPSGLYDELSENIFSNSSIPSSSKFDVEGIKQGTATITITSKSPKTGRTYTDTQYWTIVDASKAVIKSDSPSKISLKYGQSYTFKLTATPEAISAGIQLDVAKGGYTPLKRQITYKGNGVYFIKVTAIGEDYMYDIQKGDTADLWAKAGNLRDGQTLCTISIV